MNWDSSSKDVIIAQIFILDQYDCIQRLHQRIREPARWLESSHSDQIIDYLEF